jgi:DNA-binding Lrp family transcriptional regulator
MQFSPSERQVLRLVQGTLPDSPTPYADIARQAGITEEEVLELLRRLKEGGQIRRFGATLRHQQAGYGCNAMVAWFVEEGADEDAIGRTMASQPEISHCYLRRHCLDWPYSLYTMIHGRSQEECTAVIKRIEKLTGLTQYDVLFSQKELKKTSMEYF